jgi:hypothetical protein
LLLALLRRGDSADVLGATPVNGFYRLAADRGGRGWAYARYLRLVPPPDTSSPAFIPVGVATTIEEAWPAADLAAIARYKGVR